MAAALEREALLDWLVSSWCFGAKGHHWAARLGFGTSWATRPAASVCLSRVHRVWSADLLRIAGRLIDRNRFETLDAAFAKIDQRAARLVSPRTSAVLAREDACLASFRSAQLYCKPRIYLLPTAHYATVRQWMQREADEVPEVLEQAEIEQDFAPERLARKEAELKAASFVMCPSRFVQESVRAAGVEPERTVLMPFGAGAPGRRIGDEPPGRDPVFLYAGKISARKGVHRLIRVWKRLGAYRTHQLRLIGDLELPKRFVAEYRGVFEHVPRMARERLGVEYRKAQAFVFNALADGFGHVFAEAMACGTPVLASRNCGAPDLIDDGVEGELFEYGDDQGLGVALEWALTHPGELAEMGAAARERARRWSWEDFGERFVGWIRGTVFNR